MSSENVPTKRHYTPLERNIFLDALSKQKHVIENKESDAFNLKEKAVAWAKVASEYNSSQSITQERSVMQLKKLWANLKQGQRNSLTKEKQSRLATGGGPAEPPAVIDPEIAAIAPHLMMNVAAEFSSNVKPVSQNDMNDQIRVEPMSCGGIRMTAADSQPSTSKAVSQDTDLQAIDRSEEELLSTSKPPSKTAELFDCTRSESQVMESPPAKKARITNCGRSTATNLSNVTDHEKELREERVRRLIAHDNELAEIRRTQEIKLGEKKEKIADLEIRAAQAKLELVELDLQLARSKSSAF